MDTFLTRPDEPTAKREILKAALHRFTRQGLAGTSIRQIAADAGFTNPALYRHFSSKGALAERLFERCYRWMTHELDDAVGRTRSDADRLEAFLRRYLGMLDEHLDAVVYVNENLHQFWPEMPAELRQRTIVTLVRELVQTADIGDGELENWVIAVVGMLSQAARMMHLGALEGPATARLDDFLTIVTRALG
jgi:AcrR family transcriptional regulator